MAAQGSIKDWFTFVQGLNTEGGYFNTPANSWVQGENVIPALDGSIARRTAIDLEANYAYLDNSLLDSVVNSYAFMTDKWTAVNNDPTINLLITQIGSTVYFFDANASSFSASKKRFSINLAGSSSDVLNAALVPYYKISIASVYGKLIITHPYRKPILVSYSTDFTGIEQINFETIQIKIRDFQGIESEEELTVEKTEAEWDTAFDDPDGSDWAYYNLINQGWNNTQITAYKTANSDKLPANSKSWIYGKDSSDNFDATLLNKQDFGTSPAPKGRTIIDAFYQERTYGSTTKLTDYQATPSQVAFFAGRAWYSGVKASELLGKVYFSQVLTSTKLIGNCYQENDPTSEIISDLIDTDGGTLDIPEAGEILKLIPAGRGLLVFAVQGVYFISGVDGVFSASNYQVEKISAVGCVSTSAVVAVGTTIFYWSIEGVYALLPDQSGFTFQVQSISTPIATYYNDIPAINKQYVEGVYNYTTQELSWLFSIDPLTNPDENRYVGTHLLVFNLQLQAWYIHTFDTTQNTKIVSLENTSNSQTTLVTADVVDSSGRLVIDSASAQVTSPTLVLTGYLQTLKFLTLVYLNIADNFTETTDNMVWSGTPASFHAPVPCTQLSWFYDSNYEETQAIGFDTTNYRVTSFTQGNPNRTIWFNTPAMTIWQLANSSAYPVGVEPSYFDLSNGEFMGLENLYTTTDWQLMSLVVRYNSSASTYDHYLLIKDYVLDKYRWFKIATDGTFRDVAFGTHTAHPYGWWTNTVPNPIQATDINTMWCYGPDGNNLYGINAYDSNGTTLRRIGMSTPYDVTSSTITASNFTDDYWLDSSITANKVRTGIILSNTAYFISRQKPTILQLDYSGKSSVGYGDKFEAWLDTTSVPERILDVSQATQLSGVTKLELYKLLDPNWNEPSTRNPVLYSGNVISFTYDENNYRVNIVINYNNELYEYSFSMILDGLQPEIYRVTFSDMNNTRTAETKFKDFYSIYNVGVEKEAYITTGYQLADVGPARSKTGMYLTAFSKRTETVFDENGEPVNPSSILMQMKWDFTDNYASGKWSVPVEIYRQQRPYLASAGDVFDDGYPLVISKSKMRGRGKAVQFKFSSVEEHDMQLVGWTGTFTSNTNI